MLGLNSLMSGCTETGGGAEAGGRGGRTEADKAGGACIRVGLSVGAFSTISGIVTRGGAVAAVIVGTGGGFTECCASVVVISGS